MTGMVIAIIVILLAAAILRSIGFWDGDSDDS